ncbi:retrovirus-related pol polyprotein from transposon TNT 1-94 [Tanacetum coccineum]
MASSNINVQVRLNATVRNIRTYNGIEFVNQTLKSYYEDIGIFHQTSAPQSNGVVKRRNQYLVEATRTMLIFSKAPLFLWPEAVATASLCYLTNDSEDLGKLKLKADIGLVPNPVSPIPYVPPSTKESDILFQPMFDEYF